MTQEFNGHVGQVAGRDIINQAEKRLWNSSVESLKVERKRCKRKHRWCCISMFMCRLVAIVLIAASSAAIIYHIWKHKLSFHSEDLIILAAWLIVMTVTSYWSALKSRRSYQAARIYAIRLDVIEYILFDRKK